MICHRFAGLHTTMPQLTMYKMQCIAVQCNVMQCNAIMKMPSINAFIKASRFNTYMVMFVSLQSTLGAVRCCCFTLCSNVQCVLSLLM